MYSVAICFPESITAEVRIIKQTLAGKAGWYHSANADAHITFNRFEADELALMIWEKHIEKFCHSVAPFELRITHPKFHAIGAFYLMPDASTQKTLKDLKKHFRKLSPFESEGGSDPHLTIGMGLNELQLKTAMDLWADKKFEFKHQCSSLSLRKFNNKKEQYEIYREFEFKGSPQIELF